MAPKTLEKAPSNAPAPVADSGPKNVTSIVLKQVLTLTEAKALYFPGEYVVENALKNAWFWIQNSDQKEAIMACTQESQANALYDMILQALDVSKTQGYFIAYGKKLKFQRSYFGEIAVAKRVKPGIQEYFDVIREGDTFKEKKVFSAHGFVSVPDHDPSWPREGKAIIGAYCGFIDENGEHMGAEIMDMSQIKQSWKKSRTYGERSQTFHNEQPDRAALRTVIRRRCKPIISTSSDKALLESINRSSEDVDDAESEVGAAMAREANSIPLGLSEREPAAEVAQVVEASPAPTGQVAQAASSDEFEDPDGDGGDPNLGF